MTCWTLAATVLQQAESLNITNATAGPPQVPPIEWSYILDQNIQKNQTVCSDFDEIIKYQYVCDANYVCVKAHCAPINAQLCSSGSYCLYETGYCPPDRFQPIASTCVPNGFLPSQFCDIQPSLFCPINSECVKDAQSNQVVCVYGELTPPVSLLSGKCDETLRISTGSLAMVSYVSSSVSVALDDLYPDDVYLPTPITTADCVNVSIVNQYQLLVPRAGLYSFKLVSPGCPNAAMLLSTSGNCAGAIDMCGSNSSTSNFTLLPRSIVVISIGEQYGKRCSQTATFLVTISYEPALTNVQYWFYICFPSFLLLGFLAIMFCGANRNLVLIWFCTACDLTGNITYTIMADFESSTIFIVMCVFFVISPTVFVIRDVFTAPRFERFAGDFTGDALFGFAGESLFAFCHAVGLAFACWLMIIWLFFCMPYEHSQARLDWTWVFNLMMLSTVLLRTIPQMIIVIINGLTTGLTNGAPEFILAIVGSSILLSSELYYYVRLFLTNRRRFSWKFVMENDRFGDSSKTTSEQINAESRSSPIGQAPNHVYLASNISQNRSVPTFVPASLKGSTVVSRPRGTENNDSEGQQYGRGSEAIPMATAVEPWTSPLVMTAKLEFDQLSPGNDIRGGTVTRQSDVESGVHGDHLECKICFSTEERMQVLKECGHVMCVNCVNTLRGNGTVIVCPFCNRQNSGTINIFV